MAKLSALILGLLGASMGFAQESSQAYTFQQLVELGFEPFEVNGHDLLITGMKKDQDFYSCWLADTPEKNAERQAALLGYMQNGGQLPEVPNISLLCVKTE